MSINYCPECKEKLEEKGSNYHDNMIYGCKKCHNEFIIYYHDEADFG